MPHLVCIAGKHSGKEFPVRDRMRIGRLDTCEIVIVHDDVSREHATLRREGLRWVVQDLGSKNGTAVNGARRPKTPLKSGDRISLGDMVFCFIDEADPGPPPGEGERASDDGERASDDGERASGEEERPSGEEEPPPSDDGERASDESGEAARPIPATQTPRPSSTRPAAPPARGFAFEKGLSPSQRQTLENVLFLIVWALTFFCASILTQVLLRVIAV